MKALLACKHNREREREDDHISFILEGAEFRELARPNVTTRSLMMNLFSEREKNSLLLTLNFFRGVNCQLQTKKPEKYFLKDDSNHN